MTTAGFVAGGRLVFATTADLKFRVWEAASGKLVCETNDANLGNRGWSVAVSPDGRLALFGHDFWSVRVLELPSGKEIHRYDHCRYARGFSFSPDGTMAVAGSFRMGVYVFRLPSPQVGSAPPADKQLALLAGAWKIQYSHGAVRAYTIHGDGKVSCPELNLEGQIQQKNDSLLLSFAGDGKLERLALRADGRLFVEHYDPAGRYPNQALPTPGLVSGCRALSRRPGPTRWSRHSRGTPTRSGTWP